MDFSHPGSSVHGISLTRILEWVTIAFSRGSSWPKDRTWVSCSAGRFFSIWATREAQPCLRWSQAISSRICDYLRLSWWLRRKRTHLQGRRPCFDPSVGKFLLIPLFFLKKSFYPDETCDNKRAQLSSTLLRELLRAHVLHGQPWGQNRGCVLYSFPAVFLTEKVILCT